MQLYSDYTMEGDSTIVLEREGEYCALILDEDAPFSVSFPSGYGEYDCYGFSVIVSDDSGDPDKYKVKLPDGTLSSEYSMSGSPQTITYNGKDMIKLTFSTTNGYKNNEEWRFYTMPTRLELKYDLNDKVQVLKPFQKIFNLISSNESFDFLLCKTTYLLKGQIHYPDDNTGTLNYLTALMAKKFLAEPKLNQSALKLTFNGALRWKYGPPIDVIFDGSGIQFYGKPGAPIIDVTIALREKF